MPGLDNNTALQSVYAEYNVKADKFYRRLAKDISRRLNRGVPLSKAIDDAFRELGYSSAMGSIFSTGLGDASVSATVGTPIAVSGVAAADYFMTTAFFGDATLSNRLHDGRAQQIVKEAMRDFFTTKQAVTTLFEDIRDGGFSSFDKLPASITRALQAFEDAGGLVEEVSDAIREARAYVSGLSGIEVSSAQLKQAYGDVLDALNANDAELVSKATSYAVEAKVGYNNKRIARTEFGRAYEYTFARGIDEDPGVVGFRVVLSSRHYPPDICDCYAEADMYGLGPGIVPKDAGVSIPFHPNCLCGKVPIRARTGSGSGKFSEARVVEYLDGVDESTRKKIVGASNATAKTNYIKGLENKGFSITKRPKMIPRELYSKKEQDS